MMFAMQLVFFYSVWLYRSISCLALVSRILKSSLNGSLMMYSGLQSVLKSK